MARYRGVGTGDLMGRLVEQLADLPGISTRQAERIAFHLMGQPPGQVEDLAQTLVEFRRSMRLCPVCFQHCTGPVCGICADGNRNHGQLCVVEMAADIAAFERSGAYSGAYHVLLGRLSPLGGVMPEDLTGGALLLRAAGQLGKAGRADGTAAMDVRAGEPVLPGAGDGTGAASSSSQVPVEAEQAQAAVLADLVARHPWLGMRAEEVILATSATAEGEATAAWLEQQLAPLGMAVTRIARGLPIGAEVAFAQRSTLATALKNRLPVAKR